MAGDENVELLKEVAQRKKATQAQVAIDWLLAQKPGIVPIPGTTKTYRLIENLGAASIEFSYDELLEINIAASRIKTIGERYSEVSSKMIDR